MRIRIVMSMPWYVYETKTTLGIDVSYLPYLINIVSRVFEGTQTGT
jgi:hypothetical protein